MENWKARRGGGVGRLWPRSENAPNTRVDQGPGSRQLPRVDTRQKVLPMDSSVLLLGSRGLHAAIWGG